MGYPFLCLVKWTEGLTDNIHHNNAQGVVRKVFRDNVNLYRKGNYRQVAYLQGHDFVLKQDGLLRLLFDWVYSYEPFPSNDAFCPPLRRKGMNPRIETFLTLV